MRVAVFSSRVRRFKRSRITLPVDRVEISRWLVGQKNGGGLNERAGDAHALHLSAGELVRIAIAQSIEFNPGEFVAGSSTCIRLSGEQQWQLDIFKNGERVQQLERLER